MRLFLMGWTTKELGLSDVALKFKEGGHKIVYWCGFNIESEVDVSQFPETIFHDHFDALAGRPARGIDPAKIPLLGENLIAQFYETEVEILTMMNKKFESLSIDERKHFYYHLLSYWYDMVKKFNPDAVIYPTVPHTVYDYILYAIAKKLGVKTLMFMATAISDRAVLITDYRVDPRALREAAGKNQYPAASFSDLSADIQEYCRSQQFADGENTGSRAIPSYKENTYYSARLLLNSYSGRNFLFLKLKVIWQSIKDLSFFKKLFFHFLIMFGSNLKKEYKSLQSKIDFNKKFVYVPLSYQPEQTTSPLGGVFVDQILMIEILSSVLPEGWLIYVKEHPMQWLRRGPIFLNSRYEGYYKKIADLKNVRLVPAEINTYELIINAQAIAAVTGTAALEGLLRLKPALIFGHVWFKYCPGAFRIDSRDSAKEAMGKIVSGFKPSRGQLISFLAMFDRTSIHVYTDLYGKEILSVSDQKNADNIFQVLMSELNKNGN